MANKITNTLVANITCQEDSTQNVVVNRGTGNPSFDSVLAQMTEYFVLAAGANVIPLPISPCYQLYVRNNDPAGTITVIITPKGGAAASLVVLYPGDQIFIWQVNTGANAGFTSFTLTPSAAGVLCEYFLGG